MKVGFRYGLSGGEWVAVGIEISVCLESMSNVPWQRLEPLFAIAGHDEVVTHIGRLALHRRKASLSEAAMPAFIEDVAHDVRAQRPSSLAVALAVSVLRTRAKDQWFPDWSEIETALGAAKQAVRALEEDSHVAKRG